MVKQRVLQQHNRRSDTRPSYFSKPLVDFDITSEVGFHELSGTPLTVKQLPDLASPDSLQTSGRLRYLRIVLGAGGLPDRRVHELRRGLVVYRLSAMNSHVDEARN